MRQPSRILFLLLPLTLLPFFLFTGSPTTQPFLPKDSQAHWIFAAVAFPVFIFLIWAVMPAEDVSYIELFLIPLLVGTVGVLLLLGFQKLAEYSLQWELQYGYGKSALLFYLVQIIGIAYRAALDPSMDPFVKFLGFTIGVGLCEEYCKAFAVLEQDKFNMSWQRSCLLGLAGGVGFGVSEGIHYSKQLYNGAWDMEIYIIRFISIVGLHAGFSGICGMMWFFKMKRSGHTRGFRSAVYILGPSMILHGIYNTFAGVNLLAAQKTAVTVFVLLFLLIELARASDRRAARGERTTNGRSSRNSERSAFEELCLKCSGSRATAERLIQHELKRNPSKTREDAIRAAISRYERDMA